MKRLLHIGTFILSHLFSAYLVGLCLGLICVQNKWIDMRFDGAYFITVTMAMVIWLSCIYVLIGERLPNFFGAGKTFYTVVGLSTISVLFLTDSLLFMPAFLTRKALFLTNKVSIDQVNMLIVMWLVIGLICLFFYRQFRDIEFKRNIKKSQRFGIGIVSSLMAVFFTFYLGNTSFQEVVNQSIEVMNKSNVEAFKEYIRSFGPLAAVVSGLLMVLQSIIAPLPAFIITFSNGMAFGWFWGALLSWTSAMLGAIICFYLTKWLGRPIVERVFSKKALGWWDHFFQKYGSYSILIARLVPVVSFDLVSYAAGTTTVTFWNFFWATGLGQLPATLLYSYLGGTASGLVQILFLLFTITIALIIIGILVRPHFKAST
ncbi:TVP38/TMEM64 family protein [Aquibacillus kalidii]|uniref:TVP38/TMEM64 family protein n=1 Tax=Aquibacillus kalidii TaxID=2762597 RepID=UPI00164691B2|nr:TVP38/TMEM64 family protein [Aquibacillus kalidii]